MNAVSRPGTRTLYVAACGCLGHACVLREPPDPTEPVIFSTHLYLARHGRTPWNELGRFQGHADIPLDDVGRAQAVSLAKGLVGRVEAVFSSDQRRAGETGRIVADTLRIPLLAVDADLRERGYGVFEGLTRAECIARYPDAWAQRELDRNFAPPGGELHGVVVARMQRALLRAVESMRGRYASGLVVGHGSSLRMFIELLTAEPVASIANMEYREVEFADGVFTLIEPMQRASIPT